MKELWKDVPGYEGHYQVSDQGKVKSIKFDEEKIMKITADSEGYNRVHLSISGKSKLMRLSKLVAMAFLEHKPQEDGLVVTHKELPDTDDRLSNLSLARRSDLSRSVGWRRNTSSRHVGVYWRKDISKWGAKIQIEGNQKHLGVYNTELEAHDAYQQARKGLGS